MLIGPRPSSNKLIKVLSLFGAPESSSNNLQAQFNVFSFKVPVEWTRYCGWLLSETNASSVYEHYVNLMSVLVRAVVLIHFLTIKLSYFRWPSLCLPITSHLSPVLLETFL